ncbi:MAG: class I SAM-dependent methyltransferase [Actinomycetota bacterium]|nr:class I SAM-dependent methyltransferase [Actinomycetota bacterium]
MRCRNCREQAELTLVDLGSSPLANSYLTESDLQTPETCFPLRVVVCETCWLVQTEDVVDVSRIFTADYLYFSGFSSTWVEHCRRFADEAITRFGLGPSSRVVEVACNDGTLLGFFLDRGMRCTGIEPTATTARAARQSGLEVAEVFLTPESADELVAEGLMADLLVGNNVLAHVPDIVGFARGCRRLLDLRGVAVFEFQYLVELISRTAFDTIYHEHFSYLSFTAVERVFESAGLTMFDVERLSTHGGSLRVYAHRTDGPQLPVTEAVHQLRVDESELAVGSASFYKGFQERTDRIARDLLEFLLQAARNNKQVAGYGAAAKGNTLLNFVGVRSNLLPYVVDNNPMKQGRYLPGSGILIVDEQRIADDQPEYVLVLPWNIRAEIAHRLESLDGWSGSVVTAVPELRVDRSDN